MLMLMLIHARGFLVVVGEDVSVSETGEEHLDLKWAAAEEVE